MASQGGTRVVEDVSWEVLKHPSPDNVRLNRTMSLCCVPECPTVEACHVGGTAADVHHED